MNLYSLLGLAGLLVRATFYPESEELLISGAGLFILGIVHKFFQVGRSIALVYAMQVDSYKDRTNLRRKELAQEGD